MSMTRMKEKIKTLLINPPFSIKERFSKNVGKIGNVLHPLGLCYIASVLEQNGKEVKILDAYALDMKIDDVMEYIRNDNPDIVGISVTTPTLHRSISISEKIKQTFPDLKLVLGGVHISLFQKEILRDYPFIDFAIFGEGEYTMLELVKHLENGDSLSNVDGLIFRESGKIIQNKPRELIKNLDDLPFPTRHLLPLERYMPAPNDYTKLPNMNMITSRGSPILAHFVVLKQFLEICIGKEV